MSRVILTTVIKIKQKPQCLNKTFITLAITLGKATSLTR